MNGPFRLVALAAMLAFSQAATAAQPGFFGDAADPETAAAATVDRPRAAGRVVAIDPAAGRITLEYRPLPRLFLNGGTRNFDVLDAASLGTLGPGDKVRFDVERDGRRYLVTHIENSN
jgi:Cu/Ag efflux protein CusF